MEGSESEAVFDSLNLNPQLFINQSLNTVDDLVDDAFNFYLQQASSLLKTEGTDRSQDLSKGVACIRHMIQLALDKRFGMWEKYCLHHCFSVPEGFSLPKSNESRGESLMCQDAFNDSNLDLQMDSLRDKLSMVGKESAELSRELRALEKQSSATDRYAGLVSEALQLYDQSSVHEQFQGVRDISDIFPLYKLLHKTHVSVGEDIQAFVGQLFGNLAEMVKTASELRMKMDILKTKRMEDIQRIRTERVNNADKDFFSTNYGKGLYNAKLEDVQDLLFELKNI